MSYQPKFTDPRVAARVRTALGFAIAVVSPTKPHAWSTRYIDQYFGSQRNDLSKYLRDVLLITTDNHWNKDSGKCKEYILRESGVKYLRESLDGDISITWSDYDHDEKVTIPNIPYCSGSFDVTKSWDYRLVNDWCRREFHQELEQLTFNYDLKSDRFWHPIQNIRSEYRIPILANSGLCYQYDIRTAAPTLIHQHAQHLDMDLWLPDLRNYIKNRNEIRTQLAEQLELDIKIVKVIINALFCGARIGNNPEFAISQLLNNDQARIELLKSLPFIQGLRSDIRCCWEYIEPSLTRLTRETASGTHRKVALNSTRKWRVYFQLERSVMSVIQTYLRDSGNRCFLEHDGWSCERPVDINQLSEYVQQHTGFLIEFDEKVTIPNIPYCSGSFETTSNLPI